MSTMQPREVTGCLHGSPTLDQERKAAFLDAFQEYYERMQKTQRDIKTKYESSVAHSPGDQHRREHINDTFDFMDQFWSEPNHVRLIDADMVHFCFAFATLQALEGAMPMAKTFSLLGIYLATWFKLGKDAFLEEMIGMNAESPNMQTMEDFRASMQKIGTDRGLVLFLAKQIPCSCLDEDKKNAKQAPKTGHCNYCLRDHPKMELKKCSQCKTAVYCSKECQLADWRAEHKKECKEIKQRHEQSAALKAQARR
jgi:hypothetical protein